MTYIDTTHVSRYPAAMRVLLALVLSACAGQSHGDDDAFEPDAFNTCGWAYAGSVDVPTDAPCYETGTIGGVSLEYRVRETGDCQAQNFDADGCRPSCGGSGFTAPAGGVIDVWGDVADVRAAIALIPMSAESCK